MSGKSNVIVYGGTCAAVEAAVAARRAGVEVTIITPRMYLGEDIVGALRLTFDPSDSSGETIEQNPKKPVAQEVFGTGPVTPLLAKKRLLDYVAREGVKRLFGTAVRSVLRAAGGRLSAVEVADRSGRRLIPCSALIDATPFAAVAESAGARLSDFRPGPRMFTRRVIAGERPVADGLAVTETPLAFPAAIRYMGGFWGDTFKGMQDENLIFGNFTARLYECRADIDLPSLSPSDLASAEGRMRDLTWTRRLLDHSDLAAFDAGRLLAAAGTEGADIFRAKDAPDVFVLGASAFSAPEDRARMALPGFGGEAGRKVGVAAAAPTKPSNRQTDEGTGNGEWETEDNRQTVKPSNRQTDEETGNGERGTEDDRQTVKPSNRQTDEGMGNREEGTGESTAVESDQEPSATSTLQPSTTSTTLSGSPPTAALREDNAPVPNHQTVDEVIDLTVDETPQQVTWPSIKVGAIIGGGADGGALVNGQVIPIGYQLPNGAILRSVESQSATFEYKGQTKKFYVSKPRKAPPPGKNGKRPNGAKGVKK
jgi:hypothetical protein